jgi:hypothetical protein
MGSGGVCLRGMRELEQGCRRAFSARRSAWATVAAEHASTSGLQLVGTHMACGM